jgi:NADH-quinone oxidoreductase subunit E
MPISKNKKVSLAFRVPIAALFFLNSREIFSSVLAIKTGKQVAFSPATLEKAKQIISLYPEGKSKSALLPLLHLAQNEFGGYLSVEAMDYVAQLLQIQPVEVYEVATFYSMFNLRPVGKYVLEWCRTSPCAIRGGEKMLDYLKKKLDIEEGGTTTDKLFTLKTVECLGACGYAPMLQCGDYYYEHLDTEEKVDAMLETFRKRAEKEN